MRDEIRLTAKPTRQTATGAQPITEVLDVLAYDQLELFLTVFSLEGTSTPSAVIVVETSMQNDSADNALWKPLVTFATVSASNTADVQSASSGVLRYIRWRITTLAGTGPAVTFSITGVGRR